MSNWWGSQLVTLQMSAEMFNKTTFDFQAGGNKSGPDYREFRASMLQLIGPLDLHTVLHLQGEGDL